MPRDRVWVGGNGGVGAFLGGTTGQQEGAAKLPVPGRCSGAAGAVPGAGTCAVGEFSFFSAGFKFTWKYKQGEQQNGIQCFVKLGGFFFFVFFVFFVFFFPLKKLFVEYFYCFFSLGFTLFFSGFSPSAIAWPHSPDQAGSGQSDRRCQRRACPPSQGWKYRHRPSAGRYL